MNNRRCNRRKKETRAKHNHGVVEPGCFSIYRVQPFSGLGLRVCSVFPRFHRGLITFKPFGFVFSMNTYFAGYGFKNQGLHQLPFAFRQRFLKCSFFPGFSQIFNVAKAISIILYTIRQLPAFQSSYIF